MPKVSNLDAIVVECTATPLRETDELVAEATNRQSVRLGAYHNGICRIAIYPSLDDAEALGKWLIDQVERIRAAQSLPS